MRTTSSNRGTAPTPPFSHRTIAASTGVPRSRASSGWRSAPADTCGLLSASNPSAPPGGASPLPSIQQRRGQHRKGAGRKTGEGEAGSLLVAVNAARGVGNVASPFAEEPYEAGNYQEGAKGIRPRHCANEEQLGQPCMGGCYLDNARRGQEDPDDVVSGEVIQSRRSDAAFRPPTRAATPLPWARGPPPRTSDGTWASVPG